MKLHLLIALALVATLVGNTYAQELDASKKIAQESVTRIYLVRHAEKVDDSRDPELSAAGKQRAKDLAKHLHDAEIGAIYTTPYIRTRDTATPLGEELELEMQEFKAPAPGEEADKWAKELLTNQAGKNVLVVAHSGRSDQRGSVPSLVKAFAGEMKVDPITDSEYFNIYKVIVTTTNGRTASIEVRKGKYGALPDDSDENK